MIHRQLAACLPPQPSKGWQEPGNMSSQAVFLWEAGLSGCPKLWLLCRIPNDDTKVTEKGVFAFYGEFLERLWGRAACPSSAKF